MTLSQVTNTRDIWLLKIRPSDQPKCITPNDLKPNDLKPSEKIPTELVKAHDLQKDRKYFQLVCFMVPLEDVTVALVSGYQSNTLLVFIKQNSAVFHEPIPRLYFKAFCRRYEGAILFSKLLFSLKSSSGMIANVERTFCLLLLSNEFQLVFAVKLKTRRAFILKSSNPWSTASHVEKA